MIRHPVPHYVADTGADVVERKRALSVLLRFLNLDSSSSFVHWTLTRKGGHQAAFEERLRQKERYGSTKKLAQKD